MQSSCRRTILGCYVGYIVQAIVNNFVPLLFVMFERTYQIPLSKITLLITINFCIQLGIDLLSAWFLDRIGYRAAILLSHIASAAGLVLLTILPDALPDAFTGLLIAVVIYAVGGGLLEVIVSPVMESCPTQNKEQHMSLLHSFYCWGHMGVVLLSTAFFALFGIGNWKLLALLWALVPVVNAVFFGGAPLYPMQAEGEQALSLRTLVKSRVFWLFMVMMLCAGASEQAVSQWSSAFAEQGLGVSKTVGDLAGPMAFAAMMGVSRLIFGKYGEKLNLNRYMAVCAALCVGAYLCIVFVPSPVLSLLGCAVCGFSVGIFWPGTFSRASASIRGGGTQMFALLALALCLDPLQPINKKLWTPAFVFAAGAYSLGMFALFYYIIDVCQWRRWTYFFKVIGVNSITIYMVQRIVRVSYTSEFFFGGLASKLSPEAAAVVLSAGYVAVCWLLLWFLDRKKIYLKI